VSQFDHLEAAVYDRRRFYLIISALIERRYSKPKHDPSKLRLPLRVA